ncbi:reverse transcriptase/maturase family protein, partial [Patescibacteria group bacterium]|nr:reverse transcriptase/maturase family protein [Patescibacteria group bacterium]MBU2263689.1 reverse transcriptase/maturase family protein [Patescibacteria group bacterium]
RERERESKRLRHEYNNIISIENLLVSWQEFLRGKRKRKDVAEFLLHFSENIFKLHKELADKTYRHGGYQAFKINDPKPRDIHKASVRDRLVHHAIHRILYPFFDKLFIADSFSCRKEKGTHKAINRFRKFHYKTSKNNTKTCWVLKCDIKKFFANIDHKILKNILAKHVNDSDILLLLGQVIDSFHTENKTGVGLPLGNLTSQLFVNVYMNKFDQFVKHKLKAKYYIRYCDDFIILSEDYNWLNNVISEIKRFLSEKLKLELHPDKIFIKTLASGVDFLGWVNFTDHRVLRTKTKRRILKKIKNNPQNRQSINSYLGILKHCRGYKIAREIKEIIFML